MDCWIGVGEEADRRVVRLAGRLSSAQVPELFKSCADARALELDLTDLMSADAAGIEALQRIRDTGARLVGAAVYIQLKLDSRAGAATSPRPSATAPRPSKGRRKD